MHAVHFASFFSPLFSPPFFLPFFGQTGIPCVTRHKRARTTSRRLVVRSELSADCSRSTNIPVIGSRPITYVWRDIGSISCIRKGPVQAASLPCHRVRYAPEFLARFPSTVFSPTICLLSRPPPRHFVRAEGCCKGNGALITREETKKSRGGFQAWIYLSGKIIVGFNWCPVSICPSDYFWNIRIGMKIEMIDFERCV